MALLNQLTKGIMCLIAGFSIHLFLGCLYLFGNIQVYLTSYLYKYDNSINLNSTLIIGPILAVCQGLTVFLGPFLMRYVHPRMVIIFGSTIAFIGLFSSSFITNLYAFSFLYGAFYGWGLGICYLVPLICCWEYFPNRKGLVSGIIIGGFGFGAFFFGYISYAIANPNNAQPTLEVEGGKIFAPDTPEADVAPKLIRINCAIWLGLVLLGLLLLNRKEEVRVNIHQIRGGRRNDRDTAELETLVTSKQEVVNASSNENQTQAQINIDQLIIHQHKGLFLVYFCYFNHSNIEHDVPFKTAMKDYRTWLVASFVAVSITQGTYVSYIFKNYGLQTINDDGFLTTVGTIGAVANGLSRSFWANLLDRFPTKYIFGSLFIIQIAIAFTMELIVKEKILYLIWIAISFWCLGGHFSMTPTVCAKLYGNKTGGQVYSIVFLFFIPSPILALILSKTLYQTLGYGKIMYICGSLSCVSFIMMLFFKDNKHRRGSSFIR